ncbi:MAG: exodeoxyribonuclease VII small subunit [Saprospiraceae bacterium]|nr:exodeoxyribonuclease VII small subunit [Saprospiraceae bacterium]
MAKKESEELTYDKALAELNSILELLQNGQTGLDELAKSLARAGELSAFCKKQVEGY